PVLVRGVSEFVLFAADAEIEHADTAFAGPQCDESNENVAGPELLPPGRGDHMVVHESITTQQPDYRGHALVTDANGKPHQDLVRVPRSEIVDERVASTAIPIARRCAGPVPLPFMDVAELIGPRLQVLV